MIDILHIVSGMSLIISVSALIYAARAAQTSESIAYWIAENVTVVKDEGEDDE